MPHRTGSEATLVEKSALLIAPGLSVVLLAGCSGGGGASAPPVFPGEAAMNAYLQSAHHSSLYATDSAGKTYTLQVDRVPRPTQTMFNRTSAYAADDTFTLTKGAAPPTVTQSLSLFLLNPYVPVGSVYGAPCHSYYCSFPLRGVVTSSFPLPQTLNVGDTVVVANFTYTSYQNPRVPTLDGYETDGYSVIPETSWTRLLCLDAATSGVTAQGTADGIGEVPQTDCYAVDTSGTATLISVTKSVAGVTLTFR